VLLYVTGPAVVSEARARELYSGIAARWPELARERKHPRGGAALVPAITRLDLFLAAFASGAPGESGLPIQLPPPEQWWQWGPSLRRPLRELVRATFPAGPRFSVALDPSGPAPKGELAHLRTLVPELRKGSDPAQRPADPRLWLVLAPPLPEALERIFLSTFLRAEPFARVARVPAEASPSWLEGEVDALMKGEGLASVGLVADLDEVMLEFTSRDDAGRVVGRTSFFDLVSGLEELYATKEMLEPGEAYNRLHSHTGSEELYLILEGEGKIRVNERLLPIKAGQCFGKPRGYDCCTQILNTGSKRLVFLDIGTADGSEIDLCRYPEHGELLARSAGHRWFVSTGSIRPGAELSALYENRYFRKAVSTS
jgi:uncharacterized cupin superfamily protein